MKNEFFRKPFFTEYFLVAAFKTISFANIIESEKKTLDFSTITNEFNFCETSIFCTVSSISKT